MPPDRGTRLAAWPTPVRGVNQALPAHEIGIDELRDALNMALVHGVFQPRRGLVRFGSTVFSARALGAFEYRRADAVALPLIATQTRLLTYEGGVWTDRTGGTPLTGSAEKPARVTLLPFGTPTVVYAVHANGVDALRQWNGTDATFTTVAGTPPVFSDVTTAFDRVVGIVPPYEVGWGEALSLATWSALNRRLLADTPDPLVAISHAGTLGLHVYKAKSIWAGYAQGGPSSQAFRFEHRLDVDGPAGPAARVRAEGVDYYMTTQGRIGAYTGESHGWVADGVWPLVQAQLDSTLSQRIVAWYDKLQSLVWFAYPRVGDAGECFGLVLLHLPKPIERLDTYAAFPGTLLRAVSAAVDLRLSDGVDRALVVTSTPSDRRALELGGLDDDGQVFPVMWQPGLAATPNFDVYRIESIEPFVERGTGYGTLEMRAVVSDVLDTPAGTLEPTGATIDLTEVPVDANAGLDARGRFLGVRFDATSQDVVRYKGALLYGRKTDAR
jgi:hypothetical protein